MTSAPRRALHSLALHRPPSGPPCPSTSSRAPSPSLARHLGPDHLSSAIHKARPNAQPAEGAADSSGHNVCRFCGHGSLATSGYALSRPIGLVLGTSQCFLPSPCHLVAVAASRVAWGDPPLPFHMPCAHPSPLHSRHVPAWKVSAQAHALRPSSWRGTGGRGGRRTSGGVGQTQAPPKRAVSRGARPASKSDPTTVQRDTLRACRAPHVNDCIVCQWSRCPLSLVLDWPDDTHWLRGLVTLRHPSRRRQRQRGVGL